MNPHNTTLPRLSVIIPVYNCKKYLEAAVNSVLSQKNIHLELILVDDGSTDGSGELCDALGSKNSEITVIHKENGGASSARNAGLKHTPEEPSDHFWHYIAFLDCDDLWTSDFFTDDIIALLSSGYDLLGFQTAKCDTAASFRRIPAELNEGELPGGIESLWCHASQTFGAMLYSAALLKKYSLRFYPLHYNEDKIFIMQCLYLANRVYLKNKLLYLYRRNTSSASHMRKTGIELFEPIVRGYIRSDSDMEKYQNENRPRLNVGKIMARLYLIDMIEDHLQSGGRLSKLPEFFEKNPDLLELLRNKLGGDDLHLRFLAIKQSPRGFVVKQRIKGIIKRIAIRIYYTKPIMNIVDKKRFPIKL